MDEIKNYLNEYDQTMMSRRTYDGRRVSLAGEPERHELDYGWCELTDRSCACPETISVSASLGQNLKRVLEELAFQFGRRSENIKTDVLSKNNAKYKVILIINKRLRCY